MALLFKADSPLSAVTSALSDPSGRFVAAKGDLYSRKMIFAAVYAPAESRDRQSFFLDELLPALPAGPPLALGGDWNCIAGDQDCLGGRPGSRQNLLEGYCPCNRAWALWMPTGIYIQQARMSPTLPPAASHQLGSIGFKLCC